jgi:hypothetical protein
MSYAMMATTVVMQLKVAYVISILRTPMVGNVSVIKDIGVSAIAIYSTFPVFVS